MDKLHIWWFLFTFSFQIISNSTEYYMNCNVNVKMPSILLCVLWCILSFPICHTTPCDGDHYSATNTSSQYFLQVHQLVLEDCSLDTIPEVLSTLIKLRVLSLYSNKLVRIPSRVFRSNRLLRRLNLARNIISFVTRQSFVGMRLLRKNLISNIYWFLCFRSA